MSVRELSEIEPVEPMPGFQGRMVHTDRMTLAYWEIGAGAELPEHSHPHEQAVNVLEGRFEILIEGRSEVGGSGRVIVIPGGVPHAGRALTDCRILDVFVPAREDYRRFSEGGDGRQRRMASGA